MSQYIVTIWDNTWKYRKYSYKVALTDLYSYTASLKKNHDRFTIEYAGEF